MKSKLIHHVEPAFPEGVREGLLFLQVPIGTEGHVQNVKVLRSPPQLEEAAVDAAVDAVKQWRYEPTTLKGQAVPVITTVKFVFAVGLNLRMDESGTLWEGNTQLSRSQLVERAKSFGKDIVIQFDGRARSKYGLEIVQFLKREGIENVFFLP